MEDLHSKIITLHESLHLLNLQAIFGNNVRPADRILLGKLLTSRNFRRFIVTEVVNKTWKTKGKIIIDKIDDSVFKFLFCSLEDWDFIFNG